MEYGQNRTAGLPAATAAAAASLVTSFDASTMRCAEQVRPRVERLLTPDVRGPP
jgi:hypothetical protein